MFPKNEEAANRDLFIPHFDELDPELVLYRCTCGSFLYFITLTDTCCAGCGKPMVW